MKLFIEPKFKLGERVRVIGTKNVSTIEIVEAVNNKYRGFSVFYKLKNKDRLIREIDLTKEKEENDRITLVR